MQTLDYTVISGDRAVGTGTFDAASDAEKETKQKALLAAAHITHPDTEIRLRVVEVANG